ncbi:MAG: DUF1934 domain-containing protein [Epulopiscium sp.]|nr:DUF1934 domain-containing protein [Candidatus Epulonipiscium sp.]
MKKNVLISVKGMQGDLGAAEEVEVVTPGEYYQKNGKQYIVYKESELSGMENTTTTIKVEKDKVSIIRFGDNNSSMVFEMGKKHSSYYDTPQGSFMIGMKTKEMDIQLGDEGGYMAVKYLLEVDHMAIGSHSFHITVNSI